MITTLNVFAAKSIAMECGMWKTSSHSRSESWWISVSGEEFWEYQENDRMEKLETLAFWHKRLLQTNF